MSFTTTIEAHKPFFVTQLTPKQIHFTGLCWVLRAVLVLCDGSHTAQDMAKELFRTYDEICNALFVLYWHGVVQILIIDDLPAPLAITCAYRFAPLPLSVKLCGGGSYVRPVDAPDRAAQPASTGFRPYQPGNSGGRSVRDRSTPSLFAA